MKKLKHKYIYDKLYDMAFIFLMNVENDKQVEVILKKGYKQTYKFYLEEKETSDVSIKNSGGKNIQSRTRQIIIIPKQKEQYSEAFFHATLAHECLHAVMDTFRSRGVEYDVNSHNEHFTYYLSFLIQEALT